MPVFTALTDRTRVFVWVILLASLLLRVTLIAHGGQSFWPDEGRYGQAQKILDSLLNGRTADAAVRLDGGDHPLFKVAAMVPAAIERIVEVDDRRVPAWLFALASLGSIWLTGGIARRLGAGASESAWCTFAMALPVTGLYYSRHLFPYDLSMFVALLALYVGLDPRPRAAMLAGVLAGVAFFTYAGYWALGGTGLLIAVAAQSTWRARIVHGLMAGVGLIAAVAAVVLASTALGGQMASEMLAFSHGVSQGEFAEGWRLPVAFFAAAEHGLVIAWAFALVWGIVALMRRHGSARIAAGLFGVVFLYVILGGGAAVLERFVVYGRLARQLLPFLALLLGAMLSRMATARWPGGRAAAIAASVVLIVQAVFNIVPLYRLDFPREFENRVTRQGLRPADPQDAVWLNVRHLYPAPETTPVPPDMRLVAESPHPLMYRPYLFEGYTPKEREVFERGDVRMQLFVRTKPER